MPQAAVQYQGVFTIQVYPPMSHRTIELRDEQACLKDRPDQVSEAAAGYVRVRGV